MLRQYILWLSAVLAKKPDEVMLTLLIISSPIICGIAGFLIKKIIKLFKRIKHDNA
jgi:hypothetical protein